MIQIKIGKSTTQKESIGDELALLGFVKTKEEIDALGKTLKEYKETLSAAAREALGESDAATVTLIKENHAVKVSFGWDITIKDQDALKSLLGDRFYDLVEEKTEQKPGKKLKEMALEDAGLQSCISIKEKSPSVEIVRAA